jgi:hypothetical protein
MSDGKGDEVLFIDWIPVGKHPTKEMIRQVDIVKSTPSNVRLIVFDRYQTLKSTEIEFLLNRGSILIEPVLKCRPGFVFLPYWIDKIEHSLSIWNNERKFHFGYIGYRFTSDAESILLKSIKDISNIKIGVSSSVRIDSDRYNSLKNVMVFGNHNMSNFNVTILTGNDVTDYDKGVLPDIRDHIKYGTTPLLYNKHKWFHALFKNFVIFDNTDVKWYKELYKTCHYGFMDELYNNINNYLPEMFTENFIESIIALSGR